MWVTHTGTASHYLLCAEVPTEHWIKSFEPENQTKTYQQQLSPLLIYFWNKVSDWTRREGGEATSRERDFGRPLLFRRQASNSEMKDGWFFFSRQAHELELEKLSTTSIFVKGIKRYWLENFSKLVHFWVSTEQRPDIQTRGGQVLSELKYIYKWETVYICSLWKAAGVTCLSQIDW